MKRKKTSGGIITVAVDKDDRLMEDVAGTSSTKRERCKSLTSDRIRFRGFEKGLTVSEVDSLIAIRSACGFRSWREVLQLLISSWISSHAPVDQDFRAPVCTNAEANEDPVPSKKCKISDPVAAVLEKGVEMARLIEDDTDKVPVATLIEDDTEKVPMETGQMDSTSEQQQKLQDQSPLCLLNPKTTSDLEEIRLEYNSTQCQDFPAPAHSNTEANDSVSLKECKTSDQVAPALEQGVKTPASVENETEEIAVETVQKDSASQQQQKQPQLPVTQMPPLCFLNAKITAELEEIRQEYNSKNWLEVIERLVAMWKEHRIQKMSLAVASPMVSVSLSSSLKSLMDQSHTRKRQGPPESRVSRRRRLFEDVFESVVKNRSQTDQCQQTKLQVHAIVWRTANADHEQEKQRPIQTGARFVLTPEQTVQLKEIHHATNSSSWQEVFDCLINLWEQETVRRVALNVAAGGLSTPNGNSAGSFVFPLGEQASNTLDDDSTPKAFDSRHIKMNSVKQGKESSEPVDGNDSWDDGCAADDEVGVENEAVKQLTMKGPGGQEIKYAAPLLSKNYYVKFSNEARQKRCSYKGDDRTVAQMANARKLLVERRQLIKLLSLVRCSMKGCGELLDQSTMKCVAAGYTCNFKALCCGNRHPFQWATSSAVSHPTAKKKAMTYTLNIVTSAAAILSGNGPSRMKSFADALNLQWVNKGQHDKVQRTCVIPAVEKCTKLAQEEMFQSLRQQEGRIVLAGDGQFDSPGSCASSCTYSLAVAGIERDNGKDKEFYPSGYVVSQAIADRRHADDKSPAMEHVAMHTALRPFYNNNVTVHELVTDGHSQVTASFKKVLAASKEKEDNLRTGKTNNEKMDQFVKMLQHHNLLTCSANDAVGIHSFYAQIRHSVDTWHEGKNIRKRIKKIAATAPSAERPIYQAFAGYFQKHLWCCSEKAAGDPEEFKERWLSLLNHVQGDHRRCDHSNLNKKDGVSPKTAAFGTLKKFITDIAKKAEQLCRFRHTGALENFHSVSLIYTSKRIFYTYDTLMMRKRLAILHYNHNVNRPWKCRENGEIVFKNVWSKVSKTYIPRFPREETNFDYIGHLMAAVLYERVTGEGNLMDRLRTAKISPQHPRHIRRSLAPYAESPTETLKTWKSRYPAYRKVTTAARSIDSSDDEEVSEDSASPSTDDDDDDDDHDNDDDDDHDDHDDDYNESDSSGDEEH